MGSSHLSTALQALSRHILPKNLQPSAVSASKSHRAIQALNLGSFSVQ